MRRKSGASAPPLGPSNQGSQSWCLASPAGLVDGWHENLRFRMVSEQDQGLGFRV